MFIRIYKNSFEVSKAKIFIKSCWNCNIIHWTALKREYNHCSVKFHPVFSVPGDLGTKVFLYMTWKFLVIKIKAAIPVGFQIKSLRASEKSN